LALGKESEEKGDREGVFSHALLREKRSNCDLWPGSDLA